MATSATGEEEKSDLATVWCLAEGKNKNVGGGGGGGGGWWIGNFAYIGVVVVGLALAITAATDRLDGSPRSNSGVSEFCDIEDCIKSNK